jgi:hypothetical protein
MYELEEKNFGGDGGGVLGGDGGGAGSECDAPVFSGAEQNDNY